MTCCGMQSARRQHRNRIDILAGKKIIDVVMAGTPNFDATASARARIGSHTRRKAGPIDVIAAQQIGVTLGDAPAAEQAKSDHRNFLFAERRGQRKGAARTRGSRHAVSIFAKALINQVYWKPAPVAENTTDDWKTSRNRKAGQLSRDIGRALRKSAGTAFAERPPVALST